MSIMSIAIGVICTVLMFGAVIWMLISERRENDEPDNSLENNGQNFEEKSKDEQ